MICHPVVWITFMQKMSDFLIHVKVQWLDLATEWIGFWVNMGMTYKVGPLMGRDLISPYWVDPYYLIFLKRHAFIMRKL